MNSLVDIGINLMHRQFHGDREEVVRKAIESGVTQMIITGTSLRSSQEAFEYAKEHSGVLFSTAGVHPHDAKSCTASTISTLRTLAQNEEVVAIGECGHDFNRDFSPRDVQIKCFENQLALARETGKPLFLHERDAHQKFVEIMSHHADLIEKSVVHCFTGSEREVKEYVQMGFYVGVTGWICDERRGMDLRDAVKHIPLDKILVETDAPFLTPRNLRPKPKDGRNEPAFLPHIVNEIAKCMGVTSQELAEASTRNAQNLFGLSN